MSTSNAELRQALVVDDYPGNTAKLLSYFNSLGADEMTEASTQWEEGFDVTEEALRKQYFTMLVNRWTELDPL